MADASFKIPAAGFPQIQKMIEGYAHLGENVSLDAIAKLLSTDKVELSRTHPFLVSIGVITPGRAKSATPLGKKLGRAIQHSREDEETRLWQEIVGNTEFLSNVVSTVRLHRGMGPDDLASHILYAADESQNRRMKTGAGALIDLLKRAKLLVEDNGKLQVATPSHSDDAPRLEGLAEATRSGTPSAPEVVNPPRVLNLERPGTLTPSIAINIQLQLPETENAAVYDNLFRSLRKHLLTASESS